MVNIDKLKQRIEDYDKANKQAAPDYSASRTRLCNLVDDHGYEAVALATGLNENTVRQHYRNKNGSTAMVAENRLDRAEVVLSGL